MNSTKVSYNTSRLLDVVKWLPGIHLREVQRRTGLGLGDTVYQLRKLESLGLIGSERNGRYRRYFAAEIKDVDRDAMSALLNPNRHRIITSLLSKGAANGPWLAARLKVGKSTAIWHLRILQSAGLVRSSKSSDGSILWILNDPARAEGLLNKVKWTTLDRLSEAFLESWDLLGRE